MTLTEPRFKPLYYRHDRVVGDWVAHPLFREWYARFTRNGRDDLVAGYVVLDVLTQCPRLA